MQVWRGPSHLLLIFTISPIETGLKRVRIQYPHLFEHHHPSCSLFPFFICKLTVPIICELASLAKQQGKTSNNGVGPVVGALGGCAPVHEHVLHT